MDLLLILFILLGTVCVVYSFIIFRQKAKSQSFSGGWSFHKEADRLIFTFKDVTFSGECEYGGDGDGLNRRFIVKTIRIHLKGHPSEISGWTKNDLYTIEHYLFAEYPESNIIWNEPMLTLISEEE